MKEKTHLWLSVVLLHTFFLLGLSYFWLQLPYTYDNEGTLISWVSITKNVLFGMEQKPDADEFLFINVSYDKALIPRTDEFGFEIGNTAITNRASLASFFEIASRTNQHKFIVCDVFLESSTTADDQLHAAVLKTGNVLFPYHFEDEISVKPVIPVPSALSDYDSDYGTFTKYTYLQRDTCRTIALAMYEKLHPQSTYSRGSFFFTSDHSPVLNAFIIDFPIRQFDVFRNDTLGYSSIHLYDLLSLPDTLVATMMKNKIVMIGDYFESDIHDTLYGDTAGPLIHLNAYLALRDQKTHIRFPFVIYVFAIYFIFSAVLFSPGKRITFVWMEKWQNSRFGGWLLDYFKYAFFLTLMSVVSYLLFGIHLNVLIISLYFSIVENVVEVIYMYRLKKQTQHNLS